MSSSISSGILTLSVPIAVREYYAQRIQSFPPFGNRFRRELRPSDAGSGRRRSSALSMSERTVATVDDTCTVREATGIDAGGNETFRVTVETPDGRRECVLETSTGGGNLDAEARLLRLLGGETDVPVPSVVGVVDEHPDLPAPFFLMERLDGEQPPAEIPVADLTTYARDVGRYLGAVHELDAFDGYSPTVAARDIDPSDRGGTTPLACEYGLTIPDPHAS
ncbi:hypothetical protein BRC70_00565 [Halobacteriales archaeon QH_6_68_27]|nr:MAG: hypothetical protein BRC70_00565 [Halobacteriales archaeon QH_6_68_27]